MTLLILGALVFFYLLTAAVVNQFKVEETVVVFGKSFKHINYINYDSGAYVEPAAGVPAAKTGTLSTRTDANTGVITGTTGHGITTGAKIDIFWDGGYRANVTVGTVSTNTIPIDLGSGTDLPVATTPVTMMVPQVETIAIDGDQVTGITAYCETNGVITFLDGSAVVIGTPIALRMPSSTTGFGAVYVWNAEKGASPIAGSVAASVRLSHDSSAGAKALKVAVVRN